MAKRVASLAPSNNTNALWQAWVNEFDAAIIAFGWVRSGDTGEAAMPTSAAKPTAISTYPLWVVYKMGDALQSSCAVFMRIDYGTGGNTDQPSIKLTVAVGGTNGSGTLTGIVGSQYTQTSQSPSTTLGTFRTSGSSSSFRVAAYSRYNAQGWILAIERDKDSSGADTANGVSYVLVWASNNAGGVGIVSQYLNASSAGLADTTRIYGLLSTQLSQTWHSQTGVAPIHTSLGPFRNPMLGIMLVARPDFLDSSVNAITVYGASHNYLICNPVSQSNINYSGAQADCAFGILFE